MNNEQYINKLEDRLQCLDELRKEQVKICTAIIGDTLYKEDLFFSSAIDRSIALLDGVSGMLKQRNLACTGILLRAQIDNCMRVFAAFIAEDQATFIDGFIRGEEIRRMKDNHGKKMTDHNLQERLAAYDGSVETVYKNSSGYVHLSDKAFFSSVTTSASNRYDIEFTVGLPLKEKANPVLLEAADAFIHYVYLQNSLLEKVVTAKESI